MEKKRFDKLMNEHSRHVNQHLAEKAERAKKMSKHKFQKIKLSDNYTFGQKIADKVAKFGGSWTFIIVFVAVLMAWMGINVVNLFGLHFDPYPFILLNLFLSCIAAIQAPIIMMSQNRAGERAEIKADNDAKTNLQSNAKQDLIMEKQDHAFEFSEDNFKLLTAMAEDLAEIKDRISNEGK